MSSKGQLLPAWLTYIWGPAHLVAKPRRPNNRTDTYKGLGGGESEGGEAGRDKEERGKKGRRSHRPPHA